MGSHRITYASLRSFLIFSFLSLLSTPATSQHDVTHQPQGDGGNAEYDVAGIDYQVEYYGTSNADGTQLGSDDLRWVAYPNFRKAVEARNEESRSTAVENDEGMSNLSKDFWIVNKKGDGSGLLIDVAATRPAFVKRSTTIRYQGYGECIFDFAKTNTNEVKALLFTDRDRAQESQSSPSSTGTSTPEYEEKITIRFIGITFRNIGNLGSHIVPGGGVWEYGNLHFERCKFENMQSPLVISSGYLSMQGCEVLDSEEMDGELSVEDGKLIELISSLEDSQTSGFVLKDNTFFHNRGSLVVVNGFLPARAQDFVVERNYFAYNQGGTVFSVNAPALADGETTESEKVKEAKSRPILFRRNIFRKNTGAGTLVFSDVAHPVKLLGCRFYENESMNKGGAIFYSGTGSLSLHRDSFYLGDVEDSSFVKNSAKGDGGAVYVSGRAEVEIADTLFEGNSCDGKGGGVYILPTTTEPLESSRIAVSRCTFRDGRSGEDGAALVVDRRSTQQIDGGSAEDGAALVKKFNQQIGLNKCLFERNVANSVDGSFNQRIDLNKCLFERNVADSGVAQVSLYVPQLAYVQDCDFDGGVVSQSSPFQQSRGPQLYVNLAKDPNTPIAPSPTAFVEKNVFRNVRVKRDVRALEGDPRRFAPCVAFEGVGDYFKALLVYNTAINTWAPYEDEIPSEASPGHGAFRLSNMWHLIGDYDEHVVSYEGNRWFPDDTMQYDCSPDAPLSHRLQGGHPCRTRFFGPDSSVTRQLGVIDDHELMCGHQRCLQSLQEQCDWPARDSVCPTNVLAVMGLRREEASLRTASEYMLPSVKDIVFRVRRNLSGKEARIRLPATSPRDSRRIRIRVYALVPDVVLDYEGGDIFEYPEGEKAPSAPYDVSFEGVTLRNGKPLALRSVPGVQTIQTKLSEQGPLRLLDIPNTPVMRLKGREYYFPFRGRIQHRLQHLQLGGDAEGGLLSLRNVVLEDFVGGCVKREASTAVGLQFQKVTFRRCGKESRALGGPWSGGGLLIASAGVEKDSFEDLVFEDCKAEGGGGAIAAVWPDRFHEEGSEWWWYHAAITIKGLKITGCEAERGGALFVFSGDVNVYNLEEMSNNYGERVGAIYIGNRGKVQLINDDNAAMGKIFDNYAGLEGGEWDTFTANVVMMLEGRGFNMRRQFIWNKNQHLHVNQKAGIWSAANEKLHDFVYSAMDSIEWRYRLHWRIHALGEGMEWRNCHIKGLGGLTDSNEVAIRSIRGSIRVYDTIFEDLTGHICPVQVWLNRQWEMHMENIAWINTKSDTECVGIYDFSESPWFSISFDDWKYVDTSARIDRDGITRAASLDDATCGLVDCFRDPHQEYLGEKIMIYGRSSDIFPHTTSGYTLTFELPDGKRETFTPRPEYDVKVKDLSCHFLLDTIEAFLGKGSYESLPESIISYSPRRHFGVEDFSLFHNSLMTNLKLLPQNRFIEAFQEHLPLLLARGMGESFTLFVPPVVLYKKDGSDLDEDGWVQLCLSRMLKGIWTRQAISVQVNDDDKYNRQEYDNIPADSKYAEWAAQHYQSPRPSKVNVWETKAINGAPIEFRYNPDVEGNAAWTMNGEPYLRTKPRRIGGGLIYF